MPDSYPGSDLSIEQLVHALAQALDPHSPSKRQLLNSGPLKILGVERDLSKILRETRTIRNACMPVNKLPPEILSSVLERRTSEEGLVTATHVCQYWRSTLISNPSLWTCFLFSGLYQDVDRTLTYIQRSKSAPVDIWVNLGSSRGREVFEYLAPHIARTRRLTIQGHHTVVHTACLLLRTPSPTLQHPEVYAHSGLVHLPDDSLDRQAPSLRSISFGGIYQAFESHFPLPNLIEFDLSLPEDADPLRVGALFQFLSSCPWLQKICINSKGIPQDTAPDWIISLESLVEFDYTCNLPGRILPCLRLPRLKRIRVSSPLGSGQAQKLTDFLPHSGHALLTGATEMLYHFTQHSQWVELRGEGTEVSSTTSCFMIDHTSVNRFFYGTCVPFGRIQKLTVGGSTVAADIPIDIPIFENLRILRISPCGAQFTEGFLGLLYPDPGAGVPCRSLQEIRFSCWGPLGPLVNLVRERKRVGHQLALVLLFNARHGRDQDLVELRKHVVEVRIDEME